LPLTSIEHDVLHQKLWSGRPMFLHRRCNTGLTASTSHAWVAVSLWHQWSVPTAAYPHGVWWVHHCWRVCPCH